MLDGIPGAAGRGKVDELGRWRGRGRDEDGVPVLDVAFLFSGTNNHHRTTVVDNTCFFGMMLLREIPAGSRGTPSVALTHTMNLTTSDAVHGACEGSEKTKGNGGRNNEGHAVWRERPAGSSEAAARIENSRMNEALST